MKVESSEPYQSGYLSLLCIKMPLLSAFRCWFCIMAILVVIVGVILSSSSSSQSLLLEASSVMLWVLTMVSAILTIYVNAFLAMLPSFQFPSSIAHILRLIPQHKAFDNLIKELTSIVEKHFSGSSPLAENSTRKWIFIISKCIYSYTNDAISGSLACIVLISFFISRHVTPIDVFVVWAILVLTYLKVNGVINS